MWIDVFDFQFYGVRIQRTDNLEITGLPFLFLMRPVPFKPLYARESVLHGDWGHAASLRLSPCRKLIG